MAFYFSSSPLSATATAPARGLLLVVWAVLLLFTAVVIPIDSYKLPPNEKERASYHARSLICSFHKHSASWTDSDFDRFIGNLELTPGCVTALDDHQMEWSETNKDKESLFTYLNSIGNKQKYKSIWTRCTVKDAALWESSVDMIFELSVGRGMKSFDSVEKGCGAEDHSLDILRAIDPGTFNTFLSSISLSPHIALGWLKLYKGNKLDKFVYGEDEADIKSPWSLPVYLMSPGLISMSYFKEFLDTNPRESVALMAISMASDAEFYLELLMCFYDGEVIFAAKHYLFRNIYAVIWTLIINIIFANLPVGYWMNIVSHTIEFVLVCFGFYKLFYLIKTYDKAYKTKRVNRKVIDHAMEAKMKKVIQAFQSNESLFEEDDWNLSDVQVRLKGYVADRNAELGKGGFGTVYLGSKLASKEKVAVKFVTGSDDVSDKNQSSKYEALFDMVVKLVQGNQGKIGTSFDKVLQGFKALDADQMTDFKHEVTVLRAIATLNCRSLLGIEDAYRSPSGNYVLINKLVAPLIKRDAWNTSIPAFNPVHFNLSVDDVMKQKLSIVQTFFSAVALLHSHGIVHRDLKCQNLAVRPDDTSCAVVIDMGTCHLPGEFNYAEKKARDPATLLYLPPENLAEFAESYSNLCPEYVQGDNGALINLCIDIQKKNTENGKPNSLPKGSEAEMAKVIGQNFKGPPSDVWACAITAIQLLSDSSGGRKAEDVPGDFLLSHWKEYYMSVGTNWTEESINKALNHFKGALDKSLIDLFKGMLHPDRAKRTSMLEAAMHPYFKDNLIGEFNPNQGGVGAGSAMALTSLSPDDVAPRIVPSRNINVLRDVLAQMPISKRKMTEEEGRALALGLIDHFKANKGQELDLIQWGTLYDQIKLKQYLLEINSQKLFQFFDFDENGTINKCEILSGIFLFLRLAGADDKTRLSLLFNAFDKDDNGAISRDEFVDMLQFTNSNLTKLTCNLIFTQQVGRSGELSLDAFTGNNFSWLLETVKR